MSIKKKIFATFAIAALAFLGFTPVASADVIQFDPDGTTSQAPSFVSAPTLSVNTFDEAPGNAVAVGAVPLILSTPVGGTTAPFTVLYQATMSVLKDGNSVTVAVPGSANVFGSNIVVLGEITVVASFKEVATVNSFFPSGSITLSSNTSQAGSFVQMFYDNSGATGNANNLAGTGFNDGTLIYQGTAIANSGAGSFSNDGTTSLFDQFGSDNFSGQQTVDGAGGTAINFTVDFQNTDFFKTLLGGFSFDFNTSNKIPFTEVDPSHMFFNGFTPVLGPVNGSVGGTDFQFQADANSSFKAAVVIPEPASLVLLAFGGLGLGLARTIRRRMV